MTRTSATSILFLARHSSISRIAEAFTPLALSPPVASVCTPSGRFAAVSGEPRVAVALAKKTLATTVTVVRAGYLCSHDHLLALCSSITAIADTFLIRTGSVPTAVIKRFAVRVNTAVLSRPSSHTFTGGEWSAVFVS